MSKVTITSHAPVSHAAAPSTTGSAAEEKVHKKAAKKAGWTAKESVAKGSKPKASNSLTMNPLAAHAPQVKGGKPTNMAQHALIWKAIAKLDHDTRAHHAKVMGQRLDALTKMGLLAGKCRTLQLKAATQHKVAVSNAKHVHHSDIPSWAKYVVQGAVGTLGIVGAVLMGPLAPVFIVFSVMMGATWVMDDVHVDGEPLGNWLLGKMHIDAGDKSTSKWMADLIYKDILRSPDSSHSATWEDSIQLITTTVC